MSEAIRAREDMQPTALENGVALLHPRRPMPGILGEPFVALCRSMQRIPFGGSHGQLTDIFFLVCSLDDRTHLRTLAKVARLISDAEFLEFFRGGAGPDAVYSFIVDHEEQHQQ